MFEVWKYDKIIQEFDIWYTNNNIAYPKIIFVLCDNCSGTVNQLGKSLLEFGYLYLVTVKNITFNIANGNRLRNKKIFIKPPNNWTIKNRHIENLNKCFEIKIY